MKTINNFRLTATVVFLFHFITVFAQFLPEQDCTGAIRICANTSFTVPVSYIGHGNVRDIPDNTICLNNEESNSVWFYFEIDSAGIVVFTINSLQPDDYDFAVYKTHDCSEIHDITVLAVRCNYNASLGATGLDINYTDTVSGIHDSLFLAPLNVQAGERYYLIIDNFNTGGAGFTLDFTGTTAIFKTDTAGNFTHFNEILGYSAIYPGALRLSFSGHFDCDAASTNPESYTITGASQIIIDSVAIDCSNANDSILNIDIFYRGDFIHNGVYYFEIDSSASYLNSCKQVSFVTDNIFDFTAEIIPVEILSFSTDSFNLSENNRCYSYEVITSPSSPYILTFSDDDYVLVEANNYVCFTSFGAKEICAIAYNDFSSDTVCTVIDVLSGVADINLQHKISVYPNPANNQVFVKIAGSEKIRQITVYDVFGKSVQAETSEAANNTTVINMENLASGIYYLNILTSDNTIAVKKIVLYRSDNDR